MGGHLRLSGTAPLAFVLLGCSPERAATGRPGARVEEAAYVGREACRPCHEKEDAAWRGSHHDLAMQPATAQSVLGDFSGVTFAYEGVTSTFFKKDGRFYVRTDGADGALHEYEIAYTFGVTPLQQYLVAFPGGRYQALSICWDTRPMSEGGQRWFHLYPDEKISFRDPLHWTGPYQNWNFMCAECHSTNVRKGYRSEEDRYETTFSEIDVSCEACHGPGSAHVAFEKAVEAGRARHGDKSGLLESLQDPAQDADWEIDLRRGVAKRGVPRTSWAELETCARCHARRSLTSETYVPGRPLVDTHRPALLTEALYHADGQIQDEVYEYGSFLQSRMQQAGVTCSDCHDPHDLRVRVSPDGVCAACHLQERFAARSHHFHAPGSKGASCVECHMASRRYMVVDPRRDHSFRVPRPDLSAALGTPNACSLCHRDRPAEWAAAAAAKWWPDLARRAHWTEAIEAGRRGLPGAAGRLAALARDQQLPGIVRATAVSLLGRRVTVETLPVLDEAFADGDPLVRLAGLEVASVLPAADRLRLVVPLLKDPLRTIRVDAARALAASADALGPTDRAAFDSALLEWKTAQAANADRAEGRANLCGLQAERGDMAAALRECRAATRLNPWFAPGFVTLAEVLRRAGREAEAERALHEGLVASPRSAELHHALGLSLARQKRMEEALESLRSAAELGEADPRNAYVYAVALHDAGRAEEALAVLRRAVGRHPGDPEILVALVTFLRDRGDLARARSYADKLLALDPADARARSLARDLSRSPGR
jgi:Flp pilus assembly protein TadD